MGKDEIYIFTTVSVFIALMLGAHFGAPYLIERDERIAHEAQVAELSVLEQTLRDIVLESEQLSALFRKIDGAQSTEPEALAATNAAIDLALKVRGFTTLDELRQRLDGLDVMYAATREQIKLVTTPIPKPENRSRSNRDKIKP